MKARWYITTIDSLLASPLAQDHALLILEHIFYSMVSTTCRYADGEDHIEFFRYYLDHGLYYSRSESEIFQDLHRDEDRSTRERLFKWFKECRNAAPSKALNFRYYIQDRKIGLCFEEGYTP